MDIDHERLDPLRRGQGAVPEHVVDEFVTGRLTRRDFIRRAALVGLSASTVTGILAACDSGSAVSAGGTAGQGRTGAAITAGCVGPTAAPNPLLVIDIGGIQLLNQVGEGLVLIDADNTPQPWLATKWNPNGDGTVWTFTLRQGVKFSDGTPMTADDVVYTYQAHCDPKNSPNALSLFAGILEPSGVVKVDEQTVQFRLKVPYGAFPSAVSSANYNAVVVPKGTDFAKWANTFIGTGPFMLKSFSQTSGAQFVKNPHYWGTVHPASLEMKFYADEQPMVAALQARAVDCIGQFTVSNSPQLLGGAYTVVKVKGSGHRALSMRTDLAPFTDKRVRQAIALTLDRPAIISALFKEYAQLGNDSPFAPSFPQTDKDVPQRKQDLALAKQLLAQAGVERGFAAPLYTERLQEMPQFAQIVKQSTAKIGVDVSLNVDTIKGYYGEATFGKSHWLDGQLSLVDYGGRPDPNLFLQAPLQTTDPRTKQGSWNAAHFSNATYDKLTKQYVAAVDLDAQRKLATQIQTLLLDETPVIYPYFYDFLAASQKNVYGIKPLGGQTFFLNEVTKG